jgi:hypothetical protein
MVRSTVYKQPAIIRAAIFLVALAVVAGAAPVGAADKLRIGY